MIPLYANYHKAIVEQSKKTPTFFMTYEQLIIDQLNVSK